MGKRFYLLAFCLSFMTVCFLLPGKAVGDTPALDSNDFLIDTYSGLQIGSIRTTTMGGAYTGIAERSQGIMYNPAAVAQRVWYSRYMFDYDVGYAYLNPGLFLKEHADIDNDGDKSFNYRNYMIGVVYAALRAGKIGGGGVTRLQRYVLVGRSGLRMPVLLGYTDIAAGFSALEDFIVLGAGVRLAFMNISIKGVEKSNALTYLSTGLLAGVLFRFKRMPLRIGFSVSFPIPKSNRGWTSGVVDCEMPDGDLLKKVGAGEGCGGEGLIVPDGIVYPWSVRVGFAYYIGKLNWNESWSLEKRKVEYSSKVPVKTGGHKWSTWQSRYMMERGDVDRRYAVFAVDIEVVGGVKNGIGVEGFLDQKWKRSLGSPTVSVHAGVESEVWADWLVLRAGGYAEPSRFKRLGYRGHGTFGFNLKLFSICAGSSRITFRGSAGFDVARDYFNTGFSIGFWR